MEFQKYYDELDDILVSMLRLKDIAFLASFLASTRIVFEETGNPRTNGHEIFMPADMWDTWSTKIKAGVLLHEVLHIVLQHIPTTLQLNLDHRKGNQAGDYQINILVKEAGLDLPAGILYDLSYKDMGFEEIYQLLPEPDEDYESDWEMPGEGEEDGDGDQEGDQSGSDGQPSLSGEQIRDKIERKLIDAAVATELTGGSLAGSGAPSEVIRKIEELRNPKLPWNVLLRKYFTSRFGTDKTSFAKRNRRFRNVVVPTKSSKGMGKVSFYEDLSGSITIKEHSLQVAEMQFIQSSMNPEEITFNGFTHVLDKTQYFSRGRPMVPDWNITGGTNIKPVLLDIIEKTPQIAVIFTDGCFHMPEDVLQAVKTPIIWVIVNNPDWIATKGQVLHMEIK